MGPLVNIARQSGKCFSIFSGARLVEHFAEAVDVRLGSSCAFGWNEPLGAYEGLGIAHVRHKPYVRKLGQTIHENDVRWLHIAMPQTALMQIRECLAQRRPQ